MVDIFKTNVQGASQASELLSKIGQQFPELAVNFDLEDCDRILRVEGIRIPTDKITKTLVAEGYFCEALK